MKQLGRVLRVIAHLAKGILLVWFVFPHINAIQRDAMIVGWSQEMLGILRTRLRLLGHIPPTTVSSVLFAANHISWLDILALNAFRRVRFVAKAEVRRWPVIGWLAARTGTTFLQRSRNYEVPRLVRTVSRSLRKGHCVALFPEGTTTDGTSVQPFHSGLFESAITAEAMVWPVGLRYLRPDGTADVEAAFIGEDSLITSILRIVSRPTTDIHLWFAPPLVATGSTRRELAQQAREAIAQWVEGHRDRVDISAIFPNFMSDPIIPPLSAA
jgi:1-acyl-sn-glycerol-3-phosphate acyltransferase